MNLKKFRKVKRFLAVLMALAMILSMSVTAFAGNDKVENVYGVGDSVKQDFNNAQFHCNAISGNGRVWPSIPADMKKFDGQLVFIKSTGTKWDLSGVRDKAGKILDMVVCPNCGSTSWITFSNNSGVPDGKNVQMQHDGSGIQVNKVWNKLNLDIDNYYEGVVFWSKFMIALSSGINFTVTPGGYFIPKDLTIEITEVGCTDGFILVNSFKENNVYTFINEDDEYVPPITDDAIRYYAICQLWNDLMWGYDGYGLSGEVYSFARFDEENGTSIRGNDSWPGPLEDATGMFVVGATHRAELMRWHETADPNVRYVPFGNPLSDNGFEWKWDEWADYILYEYVDGESLQSVCSYFGIDVEGFIASYDTAGFLTRNNLWK